MSSKHHYNYPSTFPTKFRNQFLILDYRNNIVSKLQFDNLFPFINGYAIFAKKSISSTKKLFGIVSEKGEIILESKYFQIDRLKNNPLKFILSEEKKSTILFDIEKNKILYSGIKNHYEKNDCEFLVINKGSLYSPEAESDRSIQWSYDGESYGLIDFEGNEVIPTNLDLIDFPKENILRANKYCTTIEDVYFDFDKMKYLNNIFIPVGGFAFYLFLDKKNYKSDSYTYCWSFCEGIGRVAIGGINEVLLMGDSDYERTYCFKSISYGYINKSGDLIFQTDVDGLGYDFVNGHAVVRNNKNYWTWVNIEGKLLTDYIFKSTNDFSKEGLALAKTDRETYCFINTKGEIVSQEYKNASHFIDGFAFVTDIVSKFIYPNFKSPAFSKSLDVNTELVWIKGNVACLSENNNTILYDIENGKKILEKEFVEMNFINDTIIHCKSNSTSDIYDLEIFSIYKINSSNSLYNYEFHLKNKCILKSISSHDIDDDFIFLKKNNKVGVHTLDGTEIVPIEYEKIYFIDGLFAIYENKNDLWENVFGYYSTLGVKFF